MKVVGSAHSVESTISYTKRDSDNVLAASGVGAAEGARRSGLKIGGWSPRVCSIVDPKLSRHAFSLPKLQALAEPRRQTELCVRDLNPSRKKLLESCR